jgi:hypothetical protein
MLHQGDALLYLVGKIGDGRGFGVINVSGERGDDEILAGLVDGGAWQAA